MDNRQAVTGGQIPLNGGKYKTTGEDETKDSCCKNIAVGDVHCSNHLVFSIYSCFIN